MTRRAGRGRGRASALCRGLLLLSALPLAAWARHDFSRYEIILQRKPFGSEAPPAVFGPGGSATNNPEAAAKTLKLSDLVRDSQGGVLIGLRDDQAKKSYLLRVGEEEDGIVVLDVDYEGEKAQVRRDGIERWISMSGEIVVSGVDGRPGQSLAALTPGSPVRPPRRSGKVGMTKEEYQKQKDSLPKPMSPMRRRLAQEDPEFLELTSDEMDQYLREYNMDLIRANGEMGPALPIELTPDEDAQLVKEGVLPPSP